MAANVKIPVIILSGFLGSGKTSLLTRALKQPQLANSAIIVNEFGRMGLDHHLLSRVEERTLLVGGGCVCCSMREDLVNACMELLEDMQRGAKPRVDRIIVETTGLADPSPIWFTVLRHPVLQHHFHVESVLVTVDAVNGMLHLDSHDESIKQISAADRVIVTKTDIADGEEIERLRRRIGQLNPAAEVELTDSEDTKSARFFADNPDSVRSPRTRCAMAAADGGREGRSAEDGRNGSGGHTDATHSVSIRFDRPLDWHAFGLWLSMLLHARGTDILRVKGLLDLGGEGPVSLNGVQHIIHPPEHLDGWPDGRRTSTIVFIMKKVQPQQVTSSLLAFQHMLGAVPYVLETDLQFPY
ncbi:cobalamin biosynthesis protein CobW [Paenibacillus darwinianus]|uniref:Cobalamin biosynthesis protein CobW n=1 Tax=Paenibacillus darwinianus TaxID=1380763 RepID=A0A9W5S2P1_9BACL|nr:GTP-binding protein [Paenibacillus darwinianus]EXX87042.1 cobalamin biosynthesis protein CobW [Paenibacillus darwinianus]EXX90584.1 cobalamin biosynthesis protein CobW [Paenibacillus darwinianus]EXX90610.1 cobalamin biosynthesis protein CobW [Paenibacillus darwinianus]